MYLYLYFSYPTRVKCVLLNVYFSILVLHICICHVHIYAHGRVVNAGICKPGEFT